MKPYSADYQRTLREQWESFSKTAIWEELKKTLVEYRGNLTRSLEINKLDNLPRLYEQAMTQGRIAGIDAFLRLIFSVVGSEKVPGISGMIPGF